MHVHSRHRPVRLTPARRRAARLRGLGLMRLTERPGLFPAPEAPPHPLPKPGLSGLVHRWLRRAVHNARRCGLDAEALDVPRPCHHRFGRRFLPT